MRSGRDNRSSDDSVRQRLLLAAIAVFNRKGYAATTVREIVDAAGVTKPVLYYYFTSKEGIYLAILQDAIDVFNAHLTALQSATGTVRERLKALSLEVFKLSRQHVEVVRLVHAVFYGPSQGAPRFDIERFHHDFQNTVQALVEEGIANGELRRAQAEDLTLALMGASNVCMEIELAHPEMQITEETMLRVMDVVFEGAAAHAPAEID
jgi:TetR/AcrR family transcriptional regulator